eukprot:m.383347 g.383347  ORF g.383347 m.383347 type:complete len:54 (+) comp125242_c0_seq1:115-276(+)
MIYQFHHLVCISKQCHDIYNRGFSLAIVTWKPKNKPLCVSDCLGWTLTVAGTT